MLKKQVKKKKEEIIPLRVDVHVQNTHLLSLYWCIGSTTYLFLEHCDCEKAHVQPHMHDVGALPQLHVNTQSI